MSLTAGQIPKVSNVPNGGVGAIAASSNTVTLGVDTNGVTCYTAGSQGGRVYVLVASTNDTVTVNVVLWILNGATVKPLGLRNVPLSSGNVAAAPNVDLLDPSDGNTTPLRGMMIDENGKKFIPLKANEVLRAGALANLTAAKTCWVTAIGSDYQA